MEQHSLSPLRQVMQTPLEVHSHEQLHIARLHCNTQMPFFVQETEQQPLARARHRFCSVARAISSSHRQSSRQPLSVRSHVSRQCGTARWLGLGDAGDWAGTDCMGAAELADCGRSIVLTLAIFIPSVWSGRADRGTLAPRGRWCVRINRQNRRKPHSNSVSPPEDGSALE